MKKRYWSIPTEDDDLAVSVAYNGFTGKMSVSIGEDTFPLPPKFLMGLFGRKENFKVDDKLALLVVRPFGGAVITVGGRKIKGKRRPIC